MARPAISAALQATGESLFGKRSPYGVMAPPPYENFHSSDWPAVSLLASSAAQRGQLTKAGRLLWDSLVGQPHNRQIRMALIWVMIHRDRPIEALALLDEILAEAPDDFEAIQHKAFVLVRLGRLDEALGLYSELLVAYSDRPGLLVARGQTLLSLGRQSEAVDDYRRAIQMDLGCGEAWWALANVKTVPLSSDDIATMRAILSKAGLTSKSRINLEFALGKAFEDAGIFDRSFEHYRTGNELQSIHAYRNRDAMRRHVDQSIALLDKQVLARSGSEGSDAPVFIVGMPRSGSTLVEQILASHPQVEGTAELPTVPALARLIGEGMGRSDLEYADLLLGYSEDALRELGKRYVEQATAYRTTQRPFFVDKMPMNWVHVGLIRLILPKARIVDVRREPLDCCFSNYAQNYARGHEFTHTLEDLAAQYRDYLRLMSHYDLVAPGTVTRVVYEELVERPDQAIRNLLDSLQLPFAESCLHFFENDRPVQTPSAQQVRQPMNLRGIDRWRPYEPWLGPLKAALAQGSTT